jgi:hypothetical protein
MSLPWFFAYDHISAGQPTQAVGDGGLTSQPQSIALNSTINRRVAEDGQYADHAKSIPATDRIAFGIRLSSIGELRFRAGGLSTNIVTVRQSSGNLQVNINGTNHSTVVPIPSEWFYVEVFIYSHATEGQVIVRFNGTEAFNMTNVNTRGSATSGITQVRIHWNSSTDLYIREAPLEGSPFYGPIILRYLRPVSDDTAVWTPTGSGTGNWGRVADATGHDGNTSYVETNTLGNEDVYNMADLPAGVNSIIAVVPVTVSTAPSGGAPQVELGLTTGAGTVSTGTRTVGVSNYQTQMGAAQTEKPGGGGWSIAAVDELKLRVKAA